MAILVATLVVGMVLTPPGAGSRKPPGSIKLYKAPNGQRQQWLERGFNKDDFPFVAGGNRDGKAYFGVGDDGRRLAEKYMREYDDGIIEVEIPEADYKNMGLHEFESFHNGNPHEPQIGIPNGMIEELNKYPIRDLS